MKKRLKISALVLCSIIALCIVTVLLFSIPSLKLKSLKYKNIKSAEVMFGRVGGEPVKKHTFDLNDTSDVKTLKNIVESLNSSEFKGYEDTKFITNKGSTPTYLTLYLNDGSVIEIRQAEQGKITKFPDGSSERSLSIIPNEVSLRIEDNNIFRLLRPKVRAPKVSEFIDIVGKLND